MDTDQARIIAEADTMKPGEEKWFSERRLRNAFRDELAAHGSLEAAVCSHLPDHYTLRKHTKGTPGYFIACHGS